MQQNLFRELEVLLAQDPRLVVDGQLLKNKITELALAVDAGLLKLLLSHEGMKKHFFTAVDAVLVFDKLKFQQFVGNKEFLKDSYTAFKNKIGLTTRTGEYLTNSREVVLAWPYKDCVLEGGQTKDDAKRDEIFWNETLAPDEIDWLLKPKVLTNFVRHSVNGREKVESLSADDNLIIKGNNLLALHTLKRVYGGKVKLIYIDPPYNTGSDSFKYNDSFNHSTWLTFMRNRLEVAKELLADDGVIFVNLDDSEAHYCKVMLDEVFGRENFVANIVWQKKYAPQKDAKWFSDNHDHILLFAKNKNTWRPYQLERSEEARGRYDNPDNDPRGDWKAGDFSVKTYSADYDYSINLPSGRVVNPPAGRCWRTSRNNYEQLVADNRIWFGKDGNNVPAIKRFISEVKEGVTPLTIWTYQEVGHNQDAAKEMKMLGFAGAFQTPKPETLLQRIIHIATKPNDLVLDFFSGSGTTAAVAHKMNRRWIAIEQMDYIHDLPESRLIKVIEGEQGGISKAVNWQGGGSFVYCELAEANERFMRRIRDAETPTALAAIWQDMQKKGFLSYKVAEKDYPQITADLDAMAIPDQQKFLIEMLDKNLLYIPQSEIEDVDHGFSADDIRINQAFFGKNR